MVERLKHTFQIITVASSAVVIALLLVLIVKEMRPVWKKYQKQHKQLIFSLSQDEQPAATDLQYRFKIDQIILDDLNRVDRCITCHAGMSDARLSDAPLPYRRHSGDVLEHHAVEEFGCTICHGGQGQAVDEQNAHARAAQVNWPRPLVSMDHIQSSCGQCHLTIFSETATLEGTATFQQGKKIFSQEGCLGCHKARGVGGSLGPDLTEQGKKTRHEYSFTNIAGKHTISNWLFEHFKDPEMVSPGSDMLAIQRDDSELHALVTFTMGMNKPDIPFDYFSIETLNEFKGRRTELPGEAIYPMICSACHGKDGQGKSYEEFETGVASIGNQDFLSVASKDFIRFTIQNGRGGRQMMAWTPRFSGLKLPELALTARFVKSRRTVNSTWEQVQAIRGDASRGASIYQKNCAMCHGEDGRAAQVISISNQDFLAAATDEFLYKTIRHGRGNTAMPGWGQFSAEDISDVIAHMRAWQNSNNRRGSFPITAGDIKNGEQLYHYRCSRCHGIHGQGDSGPALINKDFLSAASNYFLLQMVIGGRHGTAMFGWGTDVATQDRLSEAQVADIIVFLRERAAKPKEIIYPGTIFGRAQAGETIYQQHCAECHGENGQGPKAPALNNQELLNGGANGYLYATISLGRKGTAMPAWGVDAAEHAQLGIQERHDVVALLRKWQDVVIKF